MPDGAGPRLLGLSQRQPPSNQAAEQALLGALLANNRRMDQVTFLHGNHFYNPVHGRIFEAISRRIEAGQLADAITLKAEFEHSGVLDEVGGTSYLGNLLVAMVSHDIKLYASAIRDAWFRRELIEIAEEVTSAAFGSDPDADAGAQIAAVDHHIGELAAAFHHDAGGATMALVDAVDAAIAEGDLAAKGHGAASVSTGIPPLDDAILRLRAGNLYVIGGRPGMGKTALARSIAVNVASEHVDANGEVRDGSLVAYFSMEEQHAEFGAAVLAQLAGVPIGTTLEGGWTPAQVTAVGNARAKLRTTPLEIIARKVSVADIHRLSRQITRRRKAKIALIVVDYLQLMPDAPGARDKRLAVGQNAYELKRLAGELGCAVIVLSQLSRAVEDRTDRRPTMRDLRESGEIEDAADVIMFPFRPEYYEMLARPKLNPDDPLPVWRQQVATWEQKMESLQGVAEIGIPKVRRGRAPAHVDLIFDAARTRFQELQTNGQ